MKSLKLPFTILAIFFFNLLIAHHPLPADFRSPDGLFFIENKGQWNDDVLFKMDMGAAKLSVEKNRLDFLLIDPIDLAEKSYQHSLGKTRQKTTGVSCHRFYVNFVGSNEDVQRKSANKYSTYHNYLLGNDPSKWASNVGLYEEAGYQNIYDGIDMRLYLSGGNLKYDFIIEPNANPNEILLEYEHTDNLFLKNGNLHIITSVNEIIEHKPFAFQIINGQ